MSFDKNDFVGPINPPERKHRLAEALGKIPGIIEDEERQKAESQHLGDAQEMMTGGDAPVFPVIAGVQVIRDQ